MNEPKPQDALNTLIQVCRTVKLTYEEHALIDRCGAILAEVIRLHEAKRKEISE